MRPSPKGVPAGGTLNPSKGSLVGIARSGEPREVDPLVWTSESGSLEDGPAASTGVVPLPAWGVGLEGEAEPSAICFPFDLSLAGELGARAAGSEVPVDGGTPRSPKNSSVDDNTQLTSVWHIKNLDW